MHVYLTLCNQHNLIFSFQSDFRRTKLLFYLFKNLERHVMTPGNSAYEVMEVPDWHKTDKWIKLKAVKAKRDSFLIATMHFRPLLTLHFCYSCYNCYSRYSFQTSAILIKLHIAHYISCFQIKYLEYDYYSIWQNLKAKNNWVGQLFDVYRYSRYIFNYHRTHRRFLPTCVNA